MVFSLIQPAQEWETTFQSWTKPASDTEEEKCENAIRMIRSAIDASHFLNNQTIQIKVVGSYGANTNIRQNSDVDVCVSLHNNFFWTGPAGMTAEQIGGGILPASFNYGDFKDEVGKALEKKFGYFGVERGDKVFNLKENSYRVNADVSVTWEYRWYTSSWEYFEPTGYKFITDSGVEVINWHTQGLENGILKNKDTGRTYKEIVRILKRLKERMGQDDLLWSWDDANIPSYLLECLVWNTPAALFQQSTYTAIVKSVVAFIFDRTSQYETCNTMTEINKMKALFGPHQRWTWQKAHAFSAKAWEYVRP